MKTQLTNAECLAIGMMQARESESPRLRSDLDFQAVQGADWKRDGRLEHPEKVVAERAFLVLERDTGSDWRGILQRVARGPVRRALHLGLLGGVIFFLLSWATWETILKPSPAGKVSIEPFVAILVWAVVLLILPLSMQVLELGRSILPGLPGRRRRSGNSLSRPGEEPGGFKWWHPLKWCVQRLVIGKPADGQHAGDSQPKEQGTAEGLKTLLQVSDRPFTMMTIWCSHVVWFAFHLMILINLTSLMTFHDEYDFEWRTTLLSKDTQKEVLSWMPTGADPEAMAHYLSPHRTAGNEPVVPGHLLSRYRHVVEGRALQRIQNLTLRQRRPSQAARGPVLDGPVDRLDAIRTQLAMAQTELAHEQWSDAIKKQTEKLNDSLANLGERISAIAPGEETDSIPVAVLSDISTIEAERIGLEGLIKAETDLNCRLRFEADCRRDVGWLVIGLVCWVGVVPRFLLAVLAFAQYCVALRALRPNLRQKYFRRMIQHLEKPCRSGSAGEQLPADDVHVVDNPGLNTEPKPETTRNPTGQDVKNPPPVLLSSSRPRVLVASYEVEQPEEGWPSVLEMGDAGESLGEIDSPETQRAILKAVRDAGDSVVGLVLVVDYATAPGEFLKGFIDDLFSCLPEGRRDGRCVLLQTGVEQSRRKFTRHSSLQLEASWAETVDSLATDSLLIEHENLTFDSKFRFRDQWASRWPDLFQSPSVSLERAARFAEAFEIVVESSRKAELQQDSDSLRSLVDETVRRIDELYFEESESWKRRLESAFCSLKNEAARTFEDRGQLTRSIESARTAVTNVTRQGSQQLAMAILSRFRRLPAWQKAAILGSGVLAVGVPVAGPLVMAGSVISPTFLGGVCATLGVTTATLLGVLGAKRLVRHGGDEPTESGPDDLCLDDLVRSGIVRTVILELQGRSPETITSCLESILSNCHDRPITTSEQARELCGCVESLLAPKSPVRTLVPC